MSDDRQPVARHAPSAGYPPRPAAAAGVGRRRKEFSSTYTGLVEKANHLRILHELAIALLGESRLDEILWVVARTAIGGLGFEDCVIYLLDEGRDVLVQKAAYGPKNPVANEILAPIEIPVGSGIVGAVAATGRSELVSDTGRDSRYILDDDARLSEIAVPIVHEDRVIGVIDSEHSQAGFYTESHREILTTIASMASTKIASAVTIERLNETVALLERTKAALHEGERRYRMLYDHHPSMFFTLDADGVVRSANTFAGEQLGYPVDNLVGMPLAALSPAEEGDNVSKHLAEVLADPRRLHRWESCRVTRDGDRIQVRETARVVNLDGCGDASILIVSEDITDTFKLARELQYQASHDALTGLYNRREFESRARWAIQDARLEGSEHALCYLDLDQFKVVNDTAGHVAGDEMLRQLSGLLRDRLRKSDVIARLGGDEFGVLMQYCSLVRAREIADVLIETIGAFRFQWGERAFRVGASMGLVAITEDMEDLSEALACADAACYAAKEAGRNRIHVYAPDDENVLKRDREMRCALRIGEALERDQFVLYQQPISSVRPDADGGEHFEVLVRMTGDQPAEMLPGSFLPAAERYGLGPELDRWVLRHTLQWMAENRVQLERIAMCSINLSGPSLSEDGFVEFATETIAQAEIPPGKLCFEITETAAVANLVSARALIEAMKELGCRFALDDFGSGLSSFAYLKNLPVDLLKIDGAFIRDLHRNPVDQEIVRAIREIARVMGKKTVAEFVESEASLAVLRRIGVDYAQGNHIGEPRPLATLGVAPGG